jgi:repressor LexA
MENLTRRQQEILDFIRNYQASTGAPPTRVEIAKEFGFKSPNAAEDHLRALARKGVIDLKSGTSRGIRIMGDMAFSSESQLPVVGRVAAGSPVLAQEHVESYISIDTTLFKPRPNYLLTVTGQSMQNIGIMDGDLLAVHNTSTARNNQVVVARIDDEVTVKRYRKTGKKIELLPENDDFDPIIVELDKQEMHIEGIAVGIIRNSI